MLQTFRSHLVILVIFLAVANLILFFEGKAIRNKNRQIRNEHLLFVESLEMQSPSQAKKIQIKVPKVAIAPLPAGYIPFPDLECIYNFVILQKSDIYPIQDPNPRNFDQFSTRMVHRQFYKLNKDRFKYEIKTYFLMDIDTKTDKEGLKILNKENEVFSDLLYQNGAEYGETLMSFIEMDNDSDKCSGWMITFNKQLIDVNTADDLADSIKNNEIICPKFQLCGEGGTFIRKELFHLLKFGQKSPGRILNQRAEQSRRKEYSSYIKHYNTFEDIRETEFYSKYPLNEEVEVPPAFRNNTDLPQREIAIRTLPTVSCKNHRMATFIKTGRGNIKQRELIRELVTKLGTDIQPYFVIGLGSDDIQNEINSHGDLIEGDFIDTYENLPLKTMLGYQFAVHNCFNVDLFFYQDDDIFMRFDEFLQKNIIPSRDVKKPFMICPMGGAAGVNPSTRTNYFRKHYAPIDLLPPNYKIVPYCNGSCVLLTSSAVEKLYNASLYTDRQGFRIEDMYFNGIIRFKAGIELNPTIPRDNGQRRFCEHMEVDKYSRIKQKIVQYKNEHP